MDVCRWRSLSPKTSLTVIAGFALVVAILDPSFAMAAESTPGVRSADGEVLRSQRCAAQQMAPLDWIVIAAYAAGMLAIGWYYSRRTVTTEDYLLGGRKMRPLSVGLSLFATLISAVSYLSWPGEVIKHGPMMMCMVVAYPFIFLIVGWLIIPPIMRLRVTSAYEILELRLGLSVRMVGSVLFLSLRLLWMAVIIYATVDKVLAPLLGLDPSVTPYLSALLGMVAVIYTSMGGLRAVVMTDVIQTAILFGGMILTLVVITVSLGGVGAWWPHEWPLHWPEPRLYDPTTRVSIFWVVLSALVWYVCTAGSDQMAIQRYLATRDAKAARRVIAVSLTTDVVVTIFQILVGLSVLAYFRAHPHLIGDGRSIIADADTLFPRFMLVGLPAGLTGLVVAGLLAAAMSSLSSGINSSCSVITTDFIDRFRRRQGKPSDTNHVKLAKLISVAVGIVVVGMSSYVGMVRGNLLEVAYKTVNLFVAPLFGLFFMALFVRWATTLGTLVGAACGLAAIVAINYWEEITGSKGISFLCAMPLGLLVQIVVGMLVSLLPIVRAKTMPLAENSD